MHVNEYSKEAQDEYYKTCAQVLDVFQKAQYAAYKQYQEVLVALEQSRDKAMREARTILSASLVKS